MKELLTNVLGATVEWYTIHEDDTMEIRLDGVENISTSIYHIEHLVKVWIIENGYQIQVYMGCDGIDNYTIGKCDFRLDEYSEISIFLVGKWVLEQIKIKEQKC